MKTGVKVIIVLLVLAVLGLMFGPPILGLLFGPGFDP